MTEKITAVSIIVLTVLEFSLMLFIIGASCKWIN